KILAVDSTARSASAALIEDGRIISECFSDAGLTHSVTLMPMVNSVMSAAQTDISQVDYFAVSQGPGSFTGVRIGVAAVKGMADALKKPCVGLSTLEILAWNFIGIDCTAACVMDARCNQVYTALFRCNEKPERISEDEAITVPELLNRLNGTEGKIYLTGDGAQVVYRQNTNENILLPPPLLSLQRAGSVGLAAYEKITNGEIQPLSANDLVPSYLRIPQAERELKKKKQLSQEAEK
ncbi:MAG: tRNA (adenosine(37)-N6)-threonylcarbamoyltransferase complex dimerization subunit type 1 TsaB, partial [Clostridia bacterium]|nr:tRNA (adenosine(37)-N6)-threonylcarbamoyltransferase complex dimerization subunit type 1 TsaB [Clostridia bacterium]